MEPTASPAARERIEILSLGRVFRRDLSSERGLSLLELIVVLFIIGLIAALSTPALYRGWRNLQCKRTATSLAAILRYAHQQAILTKRIHIVRIDLDNQLAELLPDQPGESQAIEGEPVPPRALITFQLPSTVRPRLIDEERAVVVDSGKRDIFFYPTGHSTGEAVELVNTLGTAYRIVVDPVTGTPTISRETS